MYHVDHALDAQDSDLASELYENYNITKITRLVKKSTNEPLQQSN